MTLKDADKIKEAIMDSDDFVGCSDDIKRVIDSVPEVAISTDTDTISRQAAIKALDKRFDSIPMEQTTAILLLRRDLRELPPANTSENPNSSDTISRAKAIEAVKRLSLGETDAIRLAMRIGDYLARLSSAQPVIVPCDYAKACNKVAMNRITSAVVYMEILEDFKEYGYVLVDMKGARE